eukprot:scaffold64613_cov17-Tisochrysis_lutea.AAC.1
MLKSTVLLIPNNGCLYSTQQQFLADAHVCTKWSPQVTHVIQEAGSELVPAAVAATLTHFPVVTGAWLSSGKSRLICRRSLLNKALQYLHYAYTYPRQLYQQLPLSLLTATPCLASSCSLLDTLSGCIYIQWIFAPNAPLMLAKPPCGGENALVRKPQKIWTSELALIARRAQPECQPDAQRANLGTFSLRQTNLGPNISVISRDHPPVCQLET